MHNACTPSRMGRIPYPSFLFSFSLSCLTHQPRQIYFETPDDLNFQITACDATAGAGKDKTSGIRVDEMDQIRDGVF